MSDDLSALVRATAHEETAAAEREFPYSATTLGRYVRDVRRRRAAGGTMLALAGVVVIGGAVLGVDRLSQAAPAPEIPIGDPTPSVTYTPTPDRTPTATPTPEATPTPSPTPSETTPPPAPEETTPPPRVEPLPEPPGAPSGVVAHPGGGSGEIGVYWESTPGATGYRVYRADAADGPYQPAASIDVTTGVVTVEYGGWYEYIDMVQGIQWATSVEYYEAIGTFGYFRVTAFNAGGEGPMSGLTCAEPQNGLSPEVSEC
jgi:hypothetical protein